MLSENVGLPWGKDACTAAGAPVHARPASPSAGRLPIVSMPDTGTGMSIRGSTHRKAPQAILSLLFSILMLVKPGNPAHSFSCEKSVDQTKPPQIPACISGSSDPLFQHIASSGMDRNGDFFDGCARMGYNAAVRAGCLSACRERPAGKAGGAAPEGTEEHCASLKRKDLIHNESGCSEELVRS